MNFWQQFNFSKGVLEPTHIIRLHFFVHSLAPIIPCSLWSVEWRFGREFMGVSIHVKAGFTGIPQPEPIGYAHAGEEVITLTYRDSPTWIVRREKGCLAQPRCNVLG